MIAGLGGGGVVAILAVWYWFSPWYTDVGYMPEQPVAYSHKLHAGEMGIDCRYCHNTVEHSARAAVPPTATCMNCHELIKSDSPKLSLVRSAHAADTPLPWVRVHQLPDYAYFNHGVHLAAGVGCVSCHGRVDEMVEVRLATPLSMAWCLDCHDDPVPHLRPQDKLTDLAWDPAAEGYDPFKDPDRIRPVEELRPPTHCSGCHR
jgi:formate-dependent nitrite reductase cytochrome c552 subunit